MGVLGFLLLFFAMIGHSSALYCVCKDGVSDTILQKALDYACGAGADCSPISQGGACYNPNTVKDHCTYAVNSYYQKKGQAAQSCDFSGAATTSSSAPSTASTGSCTLPSSSGTTGTTPSSNNTSGSPTTPTTPGTTPSTSTSPPGTSTTPPTGTSTTPGTITPPSGTTPASSSTGTTPGSSSTGTTPASSSTGTSPTVFNNGGVGLGPAGSTDTSGPDAAVLVGSPRRLASTGAAALVSGLIMVLWA